MTADRAKPEEKGKKISVLHCVYTMEYGGIETVVINWIRNTDKEKFDVRLVCFSVPGDFHVPFVEVAAREGLTVTTVPWTRTKPVWRAARVLSRLLREHRVDILHTHNFYAELVGFLAAKMVRVKTITTVYVWGEIGWKMAVIEFAQRYLLRLFDRVTAHCEITFEQTVARGFSRECVKIFISGFRSDRLEISAEERLRERRKMGISDDQIVLTNVSRLYPVKAQDFLLECFKDIVERHPDTRLWIAGVGPLEKELKSLCEKLGLSDRVTFLGFVTDLPKLLRLTDIMVHPSTLEGVPQSICSGMAASLPIVASAVGGIPEVLKDGVSGLLVPAGDKAGFLEAVSTLIRDPQRGQGLGRSARQFIEDEYSLDRAVQLIEETYVELCSG